MMGKINKVPKIIKPCACKAEAACQMLMLGGMMLGQMEMPKPLKPKKISNKVSRKGEIWLLLLMALVLLLRIESVLRLYLFLFI